MIVRTFVPSIVKFGGKVNVTLEESTVGVPCPEPRKCPLIKAENPNASPLSEVRIETRG